MVYVDMFVGRILNENRQIYQTYAKKMEALSMGAGALSATASWGLEIEPGMLNPLATVVKVEPGEALVTRIIRWKSQEARDAGWAEMMKSTEMQSGSIPIPFDRTRVYYAGFEEL
jgi:uncharacterized protein YbaA (DUF1428 family)